MAKQRARTKMECYINVPLEAEYPLMTLFGDPMHHIAGVYPVKYWRKKLTHILAGLEKYVKYNLATDPEHERQIFQVIEQVRSSAKRRDYEVLVIAHLVELCVLLLGGHPHHLWQKNVSKPRDFKLSRHRTLHYARTAEQKATLIRDRWIVPRTKEEEEKGDYNGEGRKWQKLIEMHARRSTLHEFVETFRKAHPTDFLNLLC